MIRHASKYLIGLTGILILSIAGYFFLENQQKINSLLRSKDVNHSIQLTVINKKPYYIGEEIIVAIQNQSSDMIYFDDNRGLRLYQFDNNTSSWLEIKDTLIYIDVGGIVLRPTETGEALSTDIVPIEPDIRDTGERVKILILVSGNRPKDLQTTSMAVEAYTIINLDSICRLKANC